MSQEVKELKAKVLRSVINTLKQKKIISSQGDFAKMLGMKQPYVAAMLSGSKAVSDKTIQKIRDVFGVDFYTFVYEESYEHYEPISKALDSGSGRSYKPVTNIGVVPFESQKKIIIDDENDFDIMTMPKSIISEKGVFLSFEITTDSMHPLIKTGDVVIGKMIEEGTDISSLVGEIFVLITKDNDFLLQAFAGVSEDSKYIFHSHNTIYKPRTMPPDQIAKIWWVKKWITGK